LVFFEERWDLDDPTFLEVIGVLRE